VRARHIPDIIEKSQNLIIMDFTADEFFRHSKKAGINCRREVISKRQQAFIKGETDVISSNAVAAEPKAVTASKRTK